MKTLKQCYGDATKRQIAEAVLIDELTEEETMNSKSEWNYINLKKIILIYVGEKFMCAKFRIF